MPQPSRMTEVASTAEPGLASPMEVLKHRYAAGEITREQYEQMRKDIVE